MYYKSDEQIRNEVMRELRWDTRVEPLEIAVIASKGVVTLTGTVSSYARKIAAQEAAHRVYGVLDVANDIQVKASGARARTDTEIARAVRRALEWDVLVPDEHIRSTVTEGRVTLEGEVEMISQREDAERAVRYLHGVSGVHNRLTVRPPAINSADVRLLIEEVLERRADREAERIAIAVRDGEVTLTGNVRSYSEKRAVIGAVSHTPGVHAVNDHLLIQAFG
ncbi:MAG: BON domain-containing protein [Blastocatellia bacterium]